jgi:hypothetical protein
MTGIGFALSMAYWLLGVLWEHIGVHGGLIHRWLWEAVWKSP